MIKIRPSSLQKIVLLTLSLSGIHFHRQTPRASVSTIGCNVRHETRYMWWADMNRPGQTSEYLLSAFVPPKIINLLSCFVTFRYVTHICVRRTQVSCRIEVPYFYSWFQRGLLCYCITAAVILEECTRSVCKTSGNFRSVNQIFVQYSDL